MPAIERCKECGETYTRDEMIRHGDVWVCAGCKPIFLQKLQEGVNVSQTYRYGGFWIRFGARVIDGIILWVVNFAVGIVLGFTAAGAAHGSAGAAIGILMLNLAVNLGIALAYDTVFLVKMGATPGKMACGLRVITPDGNYLSYGRAVGRWFAYILSGIVLYIGYIMAAFDPEKRALHDRICETRVVYK